MSLDEYELPELAPVDHEWRAKAACKGLDTSLFFPARGDMAAAHAAIRVCETCPVQNECREYSLQFPDYAISGIWGGLSGLGRRKYRRNR